MQRDSDELPPRRPAYFWWILANLLALCFAVASWVFCLEVFGHPEVPRNYQILRKLEMQPGTPQLEANRMPDAVWLGPEVLYGKFFGLDDAGFGPLNRQFLRNYVTGFDEPSALIGVEGDYRIVGTRALTEADFLPRGLAVRARAMVRPDDFSKPAPYPVVIELLLPVSGNGAPQFELGQLLAIRRAPHFPMVIHLGRQLDGDEEVVRATLVPLVLGACRLGGGKAFELTPSERLNPGAGFPLFPESSKP